MGAHHHAEERGKFIDPTMDPFIDAEVTTITKVTDGDTVHLTRQFAEIVTDWTLTLTVDRYPVDCRLVIVNTPERGKPGWGEAKQDTTEWLYQHSGFLRARTYGEDDFGRLLTDIYDVETGDSLSAFLIQQGWPPYVPK